MHLPPLLALHLSVLLFGVAGLFGKLLELPPTVIVLGRVGFAAAFLALLLHARGRKLGLLRRRDAAGLVGLGLLLAAHWVTFFHAIQLSTVAVGLLTYSTFPVFTAFLEPLLLRESWSWSYGAAAVVSFAGVALVVPEFSWESTLARGAFWGVISGLTFALLSVANRGFVRRYSPLVLAFHQDLWAMVALLPFAFLLDAPPSPRELGLLVLLGVVFTAVAHTLFIASLQGVRARAASVVATLEPVYGVAVAAWLLAEIPDGRTLLGGVVILGAAAWVSLRDPDREPSPTGPA